MTFGRRLFKKAIDFIPKPTRKLFLLGGLNGNRICCRAFTACLLLRFGTRPQNVWFWRVTGSAKNRSISEIGVTLLLFGSRFDAIEALTETAQLSHEALSWLLTLKYIPDPLSASDEIQKLPAGHVLEITGDKQTITKWYQAAA